MESWNVRYRTWIEKHLGTQVQAAVALGVHPSTIQKNYQGLSMPSGDILLRLAEFGCNVTWILIGAGDVYAENEIGKALRANATVSPLGGESTGYAATLEPKKRKG